MPASQPCTQDCHTETTKHLHLCPVPLVIPSISWPEAGQVTAQLCAPGPAGVGRVWVEAAVPALSASLWD